MKKIIIIAVLLFSTVSTFGQKTLWTTDESKEDVKFVPYENVTKEVLELYHLYTYYYDYSGYTKEAFFAESVTLSKFSEIEDKTVLAYKKPSDEGPIIYVLSINEDNVDLIIFTNAINTGFQRTYNGEIESQQERFEKWLKTIIN